MKALTDVKEPAVSSPVLCGDQHLHNQTNTLPI